jgi:hypothetical protein
VKHARDSLRRGFGEEVQEKKMSLFALSPSRFKQAVTAFSL